MPGRALLFYGQPVNPFNAAARAILVIQIPHYFLFCQLKKTHKCDHPHTQGPSNKSPTLAAITRFAHPSLWFKRNNNNNSNYLNCISKRRESIYRLFDKRDKDLSCYSLNLWVSVCFLLNGLDVILSGHEYRNEKKGKSVSQIYFSIITERPFW
jgi:hypothetical protein